MSELSDCPIQLASATRAPQPLHGQPRSIVETRIEHGAELADNRPIYQTVTKFDPGQKLVEQSNYDRDGHLTFRQVHKYDAEGRRLEVTSINADGVAYRTEHTRQLPDGIEVSEAFDQANNKIERMTVKRDEEGRVVESRIVDLTGGPETIDVEMTVQYEGDDANSYRVRLRHGDGAIVIFELKTHDGSPELTAYHSSGEDKHLTPFSIPISDSDDWVVERDAHGNWTKKEIHTTAGLTEEISREITYY